MPTSTSTPALLMRTLASLTDKDWDDLDSYLNETNLPGASVGPFRAALQPLLDVYCVKREQAYLSLERHRDQVNDYGSPDRDSYLEAITRAYLDEYGEPGARTS